MTILVKSRISCWFSRYSNHDDPLSLCEASTVTRPAKLSINHSVGISSENPFPGRYSSAGFVKLFTPWNVPSVFLPSSAISGPLARREEPGVQHYPPPGDSHSHASWRSGRPSTSPDFGVLVVRPGM